MSKPKYLSCLCNSCPGEIEFLAHLVGEEIKCPHCGMTTILYEVHKAADAKRRVLPS